jgi:hypothetical protein
LFSVLESPINKTAMNDPHKRVTAILEYSPRLKKAFIRAVLEYGKRLPPLEPENTQNHVDVFFGADMRFGVGISPLVVEEDLPENKLLQESHEISQAK